MLLVLFVQFCLMLPLLSTPSTAVIAAVAVFVVHLQLMLLFSSQELQEK